MLTFLFFPTIICICRGCHRWSQQVKWVKPVAYRLGLKDVNWAEAVRRRRAVAVARPARAISNTSLSATDLCFNCLWAVAVPAAARPVVPVVPAPELASVYPEEPQIPINAPALLQPVLNYYSTHTHTHTNHSPKFQMLNAFHAFYIRVSSPWAHHVVRAEMNPECAVGSKLTARVIKRVIFLCLKRLSAILFCF